MGKKLVACRRCRGKKIKCSGADDVRKDSGRSQYFGACSRCTVLGVACEYPGVTFQPPNAPTPAPDGNNSDGGYEEEADSDDSVLRVFALQRNMRPLTARVDNLREGVVLRFLRAEFRGVSGILVEQVVDISSRVSH
ncbi:hypothetical protein AURDEDRAFT_156871 [Auricularia subglabra TFB-10046 SS5]|nr:hypothetical protein AURDEDRAFT_156871 [Auricularia subglabra TFB-10046 SS5]